MKQQVVVTYRYTVLQRTEKIWGFAVAQLVEALCYKPEGREFDSDGVTGIFQ
jgi:hypothetical protein